MENSNFYVVTMPFSLNLDNGKNTVNLNKGDIVEFDGLMVECKGIKGQAGVFRSVVREGEWVRPIPQEKIAEFQAKLMAKMKPSKTVSASDIKARNMTAGKIVENSSVEADAVIKGNSDNLDNLVQEYEDKTYETNKQPTTSATVLRKLEGNNDVRQVIVDNYDDQEVAKVKVASTETRNSSGVEIEKKDIKKANVVSEEERLAKETRYNRKVEASEPNIRKVDRDGDGVVVKKTSTPAVVKTEIKLDKTVSSEEDAVTETKYNDLDTRTDVGSSTQVGVIKQSAKSAVTNKKAVTKPKSMNRVTTNEPVEDQGAKVVGKIRKTSTVGVSEGGIVSKVSVGAPKEDMGDVTFSSSGNDIEMSDEATVSSSDIPVTDIINMGDDAEVINTENKEVSGSIDIDISELLGDK